MTGTGLGLLDEHRPCRGLHGVRGAPISENGREGLWCVPRSPRQRSPLAPSWLLRRLASPRPAHARARCLVSNSRAHAVLYRKSSSRVRYMRVEAGFVRNPITFSGTHMVVPRRRRLTSRLDETPPCAPTQTKRVQPPKDTPCVVGVGTEPLALRTDIAGVGIAGCNSVLSQNRVGIANLRSKTKCQTTWSAAVLAARCCRGRGRMHRWCRHSSPRAWRHDAA